MSLNTAMGMKQRRRTSTTQDLLGDNDNENADVLKPLNPIPEGLFVYSLFPNNNLLLIHLSFIFESSL